MSSRPLASPRRSARAFALLAALLLAHALSAPALSAEVGFESFTPDEGSVGTEFELQLSGDLGKGKPKLWLTLADDPAAKPRKTKLKVGDVTDLGKGVQALTVSFKSTKTGPGLYDLHVKPKGKGQVEQIFEGAFSVRAPTLDAVSPESALSKAEVTITGAFFGGKKPVVRFTPSEGGKSKKAKVLDLVDGDTLLVKLPKLQAGAHDVSVSTKVGEAMLAEAFSAFGPQVKDQLSAHFASVEPLLVENYVATGPNSPDTVLAAFHTEFQGLHTTTITTGINLGGGAEFSFSFGFPFEPGGTPTPHTLEEGTFAVNFNFVVIQDPPDVTWIPETVSVMPGTITITSSTKKRVRGNFAFTLSPTGDMPPAGDLVITNGQFDLAVKEAPGGQP